MEFPTPKTPLDYILHAHCVKIITKGAKTPYTNNNLFESPGEHTYQGIGRSFEDHTKELLKSGKSLDYMAFMKFFWKQNLAVNFFYTFGFLVDFILPFTMEIFLGWISADEEEEDNFQGSVICSIMLGLIIVRLIFVVSSNYFANNVPVWCKNSLEVIIFREN